jgi:CelD/BcsL family acetyltransferase involved in cellulose biosynthesis
VSGLGVEIVTSAASLLAMRAAWQELFEASPHAAPYLSPGWALVWWKHFGGRQGPGPLAGRARPRAIAVREGGQLVGLAPLLETRVGLGSASIRTLVGIGQETADYGGVLLGPEPERVAPVLLDALDAELRGGRTIYDATRLAPDDPWAAALEACDGTGGRRARAVQQEAYPYLDLAAMDDPVRSVSKLLKRNDVRRRWRRLDEAHGATFTYHRPGHAREDLATFLRLHDQRWATKDHPPAGLFAPPAGRAFLADAVEELDAAGLLRISFVHAGGEAIVGRFGFEHRGIYHGVKSGWDPAFASFGPGHLVVGKILEHAAERGLVGFDFMRGAGDHKAAWTDQERSVPYLVVGPGGRTAPVLERAMWATLALRTRRRSAGGPTSVPGGAT